MGAAPEDVPTQLGRYRILKHLASGGMAEVFLAITDGIEGFQRHVVVKRIHREHARNAQFVSMFLDEARLAASLHHHNIVQVHDIGNADGEYFYAMEYVHGEDLRGLLRRVAKLKQKVPLEHVVAIVIGAAAGLHYAHEHKGPDRKPLGIVHRDVSPSNIVLDYDGNVKVVDFGIAKAAQRSNETKSGVLKGKVAYMSPEQCKGKPVDRRSDVYALGIVLYELTTARRLFKGESDFMTMSQIVAGKIPAPSSRRPDLPRELEGIIMNALAKEPENRYQTAHELRLALEQFAAAAGLRTSSTGLAAYMTEIFGERPEPWLVEGAMPVEDLTADFDGAASGVAAVSMSNIEEFVNAGSEATSSPLLRARKKAAARGEQIHPAVDDEIAEELERHGERARRPSQMSGTPMAWTPSPASQVENIKPRRSWAAILVATTLVAGGAAVATLRPWESSSSSEAATSRSVAPAAAPTPAAKPSTPAEPTTPTPGDPMPADPKPADPIAADPKPADPPVETPVAATPEEPVAAKQAQGKKLPAKRKVTKRPVKKTGSGAATTTDPNWNPDELLPE